MNPQVLEILARELCPRCGQPFVRSLADVPQCLCCRRRHKAEIDQLVAGTKEQANRAHVLLGEVAP